MLGRVDFTEFAWPLLYFTFAPLLAGLIALVTVAGPVPLVVGAFLAALVGAGQIWAGWRLAGIAKEGLRRNPPQDFQR